MSKEVQGGSRFKNVFPIKEGIDGVDLPSTGEEGTSQKKVKIELTVGSSTASSMSVSSVRSMKSMIGGFDMLSCLCRLAGVRARQTPKTRPKRV